MRGIFKLVRQIVWPGGRWRWFYRLAIFLVGFSVFTFVSVEVTSQSSFCKSCHIMESYYATWHTGTHKNVECVECHIPPGLTNYAYAKINGLGQVVDDLLHRTAGKPSASVSDASCTRAGCHSLQALESKVQHDGKYFFNHAKHLGLKYDAIEVVCTTCHSHISGNQHFQINTNACVTCHLAYPKAEPQRQIATSADANIKLATTTTSAPGTRPMTVAATALVAPSRCQNCHNAPEKPIMYQGLRVMHSEYLSYGAACDSCHRGVTAKPAKVGNDQCFGCHDFGLERLGSVEETHRIHTTGLHKVECFSCHGITRHGPSAQSMHLAQIDCQSCHFGQHNIQQATYKATGPLAHQPTTAPAVTPMFLAHVSCNGCHIQPRPLKANSQSGATVAVAVPKACDTCHKPGLGEEMIPLWQKNTHTLYDSVVALLPETPPADPAARASVDDARKLIDLVRLDGSWGVHNPRYTQELLEQARTKLVLVKQAATKGPTQ